VGFQSSSPPGAPYTHGPGVIAARVFLGVIAGIVGGIVGTIVVALVHPIIRGGADVYRRSIQKRKAGLRGGPIGQDLDRARDEAKQAAHSLADAEMRVTASAKRQRERITAIQEVLADAAQSKRS